MAPIINKRIFIKLEKVLGNLEDLPEHLKLEASGFKDLYVNRLSEEGQEIRIALNHCVKRNSHTVQDTAMDIIIFPDLKMVEPVIYEDGSSYREVFPEFGVIDFETRKDLNVFLNQWLSTIIARRYEIVAVDGDGLQQADAAVLAADGAAQSIWR